MYLVTPFYQDRFLKIFKIPTEYNPDYKIEVRTDTYFNVVLFRNVVIHMESNV